MLIQNAYAQGATAGAGFDYQTMGFMGLMIAVFYFMLMRPQQKRAKELRAMIAALASGDEVVTVGGLLGKITKVSEQYVVLEISEGRDTATEVRVEKSAIQRLIPKGTIKSI